MPPKLMVSDIAVVPISLLVEARLPATPWPFGPGGGALVRRELSDAAADFRTRCASELAIARDAHRIFDPQLRALLEA